MCIIVAKTPNQMVADALAKVSLVSPGETQLRMQQDPDTLVVDVRNPADIAAIGVFPGVINVRLSR